MAATPSIVSSWAGGGHRQPRSPRWRIAEPLTLAVERMSEQAANPQAHRHRWCSAGDADGVNLQACPAATGDFPRYPPGSLSPRACRYRRRSRPGRSPGPGGADRRWHPPRIAAPHAGPLQLPDRMGRLAGALTDGTCLMVLELGYGHQDRRGPLLPQVLGQFADGLEDLTLHLPGQGLMLIQRRSHD